MNNLNLIVKMKFGSKLYGTDTPESDTDYKGVYLPTEEEILLNRVPKSYNFMTKQDNESKNTSEDVDIEIYSLHYFIKLACEGQTVALDMLHAPDNMIEEKSDVWDLIVRHREKFYTKNLQAFIGYARKQAGKYSIKGSRLDAMNKVLKYLIMLPPENKIELYWNVLPRGEHIHDNETDKYGLRLFQVCGTKFQETARVKYMYEVLNKKYDQYGQRAKDAKENKNIDWKSVSHALRAAYQIKQILTENTIIFPLKEAEFLKEVKQGKHDYLTVVAPTLENLMDEVEELTKKSTLPEKVDMGFWDGVLMFIIGDKVLGSF